MSTSTRSPSTRRPLPEPFRESVEKRGFGLDPWVLLPLPFAAGLVFGWGIFPFVALPTLVGYLALEAARGRRRAAADPAPSSEATTD